MASIIQLIPLLLFIWIFTMIDAGFCPIGCTCVDDEHTAPSVICDNANLDSIPILLDPRIRSLTLSNNRISSITSDELGIYTDLEYLDLANNKILNIERDAFYRLQRLKALRLNGNMLTSLNAETFSGLTELRALDLSDNGLARLATSIFSDLRRLETLNVSRNSIAHLSPGAFTGLTSLKELHMQHNELTVVPKIALHAPQALKILDVSYNRLEIIPDESFVYLKQLETLDLAGNGIEASEERAFVGLRMLRHLYLDTNRLRRVPTISFRPLTELDTLTLSENLMDELTTSAFEGLARLRHLTISRCPHLRSVAINAFSGLFSLEILILSENRALSSIDPMAFELSHHSKVDNAKLHTFLRQFYVFGNNLTSLPGSLLPWHQLNELDIRFNPWVCDCEFGSWIGRALRRVYGIRGSYPDGAQCDTPDQLRGRHLHTIRGRSMNGDLDDLDVDQNIDWIDLADCHSVWPNGTTDWIVAILLIIGCLFTITVFIWYCFRYRRRFMSHCCCCVNDVLPLKTEKPPPPGLPELFDHRPQMAVYNDNFYTGTRKISSDTECLYVGDEQGDSEYARPYGNENVDFTSYPIRNSLAYGYYGCSPEETRSFLPRITSPVGTRIGHLYANTSDYYSGISSSASPSPPSDSTPRTTSSGYLFNREASFRIIQRYPIPITEL